MELEVKFRTWYKGIPPQPIKLKIPGWAGQDHNHSDGAVAQPWHCMPFVEGSVYGLELIYPYDSECRVTTTLDGKIHFEGDFKDEAPQSSYTRWPPFDVFAPGHYGFTSSLDIVPPAGYVTRIEPHPKYFTDHTWQTPLPVTGHLQGEWWPRIFFVAFKAPPPGQAHVFKKHSPYAQIIFVPKKVTYDIFPMDVDEAKERIRLDELISKYEKYLCDNSWKDSEGHNFNDKYKVMARLFNKGGIEAVKEFIEQRVQAAEELKKNQSEAASNRMKRRLVVVDKPHEVLKGKEE